MSHNLADKMEIALALQGEAMRHEEAGRIGTAMNLYRLHADYCEDIASQPDCARPAGWRDHANYSRTLSNRLKHQVLTEPV